jgi:biopolymer transport protein ExbB
MKNLNIKYLKKPALILFSVLALMPGLSHAWWSGDWSARKKITLNMTQADTKSTVSQAPILVRLHTGNFDFANTKDDGGDIRFVAEDDKTALKYHIEKYDPVNELALIWVQAPKLESGKPSAIYMYSGNSKTSKADDVANTYDANTVAVYHFGEKDGLPKDSTASNNNSTQFVAKLGDGSLIGGGATFDGQGGMTIAASPSLKVVASQGLTVSAWIKVLVPQANAVLFQQQDGAKSIVLGIEAGKLYASTDASSTPKTTEIVPSAWHHVALTIGQGLTTLYLDGNQVATAAATIADMQGEIAVGKGYSGVIDELEVSNSARSADWIKVAAKGQGQDAQLLTYGEDEASGGEGSTSYFGVLFRSLTTDAWVVIIILSIMFVISVAVMITKAMLVIRTDKGNKQFHSHFRSAQQDLLELEQKASNADSTLFRLYIAGLREIRKRNTDNDKLELSGAAMDAIKAAIDADLIRETQKMNSQMVLLTIAISGGPFLGLLGTVVGVMITFAAIAAAGDVNVNAIAPGIAAALLATVAGLGVAIPALFGYNYLASRIKNITVDMQIFVDEFVTRVAELYGR